MLLCSALDRQKYLKTQSLIGRIHGAIVAAIVAATGRSDRRGDDRSVYTPQATGRRDDRQLVARLNRFTYTVSQKTHKKHGEN